MLWQPILYSFICLRQRWTRLFRLVSLSKSNKRMTVRGGDPSAARLGTLWAATVIFMVWQDLTVATSSSIGSNERNRFFLRSQHWDHLTSRQFSRSSSSIGTRTITVFAAALALPPPARLQQLLQSEMDGTRSSMSPILLPCCYDGLTARLVARAGFEATFMTGFGVSGAYGYPDTQLISALEMMNAAHYVAQGLASVASEQQQQQQQQLSSQEQRLPIPCIADGDTGYGNAINVKRTIYGYAQAGMAGVMMEDQVQPKRCGHVDGKAVVPMIEAVQRIRAACDARDEYSAMYGPGTGPLIMARTDALRTDGLSAALERCLAFQEAGADMTFLEAPESIEQMEEYCRTVPGPKLANMLEQGSTPILPPSQLKAMGYTMAAYPLTLLSASINAMQISLDRIKDGRPTDDLIVSFAEAKDVVGFSNYAKEEQRYRFD